MIPAAINDTPYFPQKNPPSIGPDLEPSLTTPQNGTNSSSLTHMKKIYHPFLTFGAPLHYVLHRYGDLGR